MNPKLAEFTLDELCDEVLVRASALESTNPNKSYLHFDLWAKCSRAQRLIAAKRNGYCAAIPPPGKGRGFEVCEEPQGHAGDHIWWDRAQLSGTITWPNTREK